MKIRTYARSYTPVQVKGGKCDEFSWPNWKRISVVCLLVLGIAGCAPAGIEATRVGQEMRNSRSEGADAILGDAVFAVIRGRSADEAIETLAADGATCTSFTCVWRFLDNETVWDTAGVRPSGPPRSWITTYQVAFVSQLISKRSDITAAVTSEEIN